MGDFRGVLRDGENLVLLNVSSFNPGVACVPHVDGISPFLISSFRLHLTPFSSVLFKHRMVCVMKSKSDFAYDWRAFVSPRQRTDVTCTLMTYWASYFITLFC